ncbi:hypothetical protein KIN20_034469 [Parelaphostrongylus tenuis]|uniref:Uncharacterized protein n=1 Tax=Parelaphostrongylus tenuis TaxID=148309 RepID=A0AAD5WJP4_PARTN|nr:hypothetical protein KIN20_034469 [Parelaphostrongylus tenuis]
MIGPTTEWWNYGCVKKAPSSVGGGRKFTKALAFDLKATMDVVFVERNSNTVVCIYSNSMHLNFM